MGIYIWFSNFLFPDSGSFSDLWCLLWSVPDNLGNSWSKQGPDIDICHWQFWMIAIIRYLLIKFKTSVCEYIVDWACQEHQNPSLWFATHDDLFKQFFFCVFSRFSGEFSFDFLFHNVTDIFVVYMLEKVFIILSGLAIPFCCHASRYQGGYWCKNWKAQAEASWLCDCQCRSRLEVCCFKRSRGGGIGAGMGDDESPCQSVEMEERVAHNRPSLEISFICILYPWFLWIIVCISCLVSWHWISRLSSSILMWSLHWCLVPEELFSVFLMPLSFPNAYSWHPNAIDTGVQVICLHWQSDLLNSLPHSVFWLSYTIYMLGCFLTACLVHERLLLVLHHIKQSSSVGSLIVSK